MNELFLKLARPARIDQQDPTDTKLTRQRQEWQGRRLAAETLPHLEPA